MIKLRKKDSLNAFYAWLPLAVVTTSLSLLVYLTAQQVLRQGANDPQIQMVEDSKRDVPAVLAQNNTINTGRKIDVAQSLAVVEMQYDKDGKIISSSGVVDGRSLDLPSGVFDEVRKHGQRRFTWQPKPGVRLATVIDMVEQGNRQGFVLAARSLREVEKRDKQLLVLMLIGWITTLSASYVVTYVFEKK